MESYQETEYYTPEALEKTDQKTKVALVYEAMGGSVHIEHYEVPSEYAQTNSHHLGRVISPMESMQTLSSLRMNGGIPVDGPDNTPSQTTMIWHSTSPQARMTTPDFMMGVYKNGKRFAFHGGTPFEENKTQILLGPKVEQALLNTYHNHLHKPAQTAQFNAKPSW